MGGSLAHAIEFAILFAVSDSFTNDARTSYLDGFTEADAQSRAAGTLPMIVIAQKDTTVATAPAPGFTLPGSFNWAAQAIAFTLAGGTTNPKTLSATQAQATTVPKQAKKTLTV